MPLYARAFYFEDTKGNAVAMVSCELFAVSAGLRAEILRLVNREERLEPGALILSATHTHHGPANFASAETYNGFAGPLPNFDKKAFDFLSLRISQAIVRAIQDARKHATDDHELLLYSGYATGIQRNRAIAAFYRNPVEVVQQVQDESYAAGSRCPDGRGRNCPRYLSTDPTVKTLEIRRNGQRRGLLVFYAVHPTAMTHDSELYSPDLTGLAMRNLELPERGLIAGFFNGAEGDISPDWDRQDRGDVLTLAQKLSDAVSAVLATPPTARSTRVDITMSWNRARQQSSDWKAAKFCDKPTPGPGEVGGAEDGRTVFYNYGFRGEARKTNTEDPDPKLSALQQPLKDLLDGLELGAAKPVLGLLGIYHKPNAKSFPIEFPVARVSLAPVATFAAIPVEATTLVGRAIRETLGQQTIVVGLANEYYGYAVTTAEYQLQQYEAGSTELGPFEANGIIYLLQHVKPDSPTESIASQTFRPGKWRYQEFGVDLPLLRVPRNTIDDDLQPLFPVEVRRLESRIPRFAWVEDHLGDEKPEKRKVSVYSGDVLIAEDRASTDLLTVFNGTSGELRVYDTLWIPPKGSSESAFFYFQVETANGEKFCSEPFQLGALPASAPPHPIAKALRCPP
jgi:neutral ceramidase